MLPIGGFLKGSEMAFFSAMRQKVQDSLVPFGDASTLKGYLDRSRVGPVGKLFFRTCRISQLMVGFPSIVVRDPF
jgi:hypothetical protein